MNMRLFRVFSHLQCSRVSPKRSIAYCIDQIIHWNFQSVVHPTEHYNILKQFKHHVAPIEVVTYKNNVTNSFDGTSECML